jgi:hypothetical protein
MMLFQGGRGRRMVVCLSRLDFIHFINRDDRMGERGAGTHFSRYPDRFHHFLAGQAVAQRSAGVAPDAVRTLRDVSDGDRNDVLGLSCLL